MPVTSHTGSSSPNRRTSSLSKSNPASSSKTTTPRRLPTTNNSTTKSTSKSSSPTKGVSMGNGSSLAHKISIDGEDLDAGKVAELVTNLKYDKTRLENKTKELEKQNAVLWKTEESQRKEISTLKSEINKLKSVLDFKSSASADLVGGGSKISQNQTVGPLERLKKQGVSGESTDSQAMENVALVKHDKDTASKDLIRGAIKANDFLKHIDNNQIAEIIECMYSKNVQSDCFIIREGESGQHLYVCANGLLEVMKDGEILGRMQPGVSFGELALLYNCNRTASVKAISPVKLWCLDRAVFQAIMKKTGLAKQDDYVRFLKSVPLLKDFPSAKLMKIADAIEEDEFDNEQYVVREGENGNTFFIIKTGIILVTQLVVNEKEPQLIRKLQPGDYFGEKALLNEDHRTANCIAHGRVQVLTLDRHSFLHLIGDLEELKSRNYEDEKRGAARLANNDNQNKKATSVPSKNTRKSPNDSKNASPVDASIDFADVSLRDLKKIATLGMGGFGRVELVSYLPDSRRSFALKCLKKTHIVQTRQQDHIYSEKTLLMEIRSNFICRLYKTFKDRKYVYMLMEVCLGGELWTLLRNQGNFDEATTKFVVGCVLEGMQYMHERGIVYRDLKPENLLLDQSGYIKLCDFGFAKKIGQGRKTWTFCGTPEYVAPEVILNKGHSFPADYWQVGILVFEVLTGSPPFNADDAMKIYNIILRGIDAVDFTSFSLSRNAQSLVKKLCKESPAERLGSGSGGVQDIKKHKWFQGFDWLGLRQQFMDSPFTTKVSGPTDHSNFDDFPKRSSDPPDENSGWDADF